VRDGNVFVLGDNREVSKDSRMFGEVNLRQIKGKVVLRINRDGITRF
jgi:signal peptidase I